MWHTLYSMGKVLMEVAQEMARDDAAASDAKEDVAVPEKKVDAPEEKPAKKEIHLEDVRAVLSDISRSGHTAEMKALLSKHGAKKLSDIKPEDYEQLLAEAEEVKNA